MSLEIPPNGSRGQTPITDYLVKLPRPLQKLLTEGFKTYMRLRGARLLDLTTVGNKSGKTRQVSVVYFPDGDMKWIIVASVGGAAKHPAWFLNLARNPDKVWVTVDKRELHVQPELLKDAEREAAWKRITAEAPYFETYQMKTDRVIPIVRLTAIQ